MDNSTNTSPITSTYHKTTSTTNKSTKKYRGATIMTKLSKSHQSGIMYPIILCPRTYKVYGENGDSFKSYVALKGIRKFSIIINHWNDVPGELQ